jgi:hypothetical protein
MAESMAVLTAYPRVAQMAVMMVQWKVAQSAGLLVVPLEGWLAVMLVQSMVDRLVE